MTADRRTLSWSFTRIAVGALALACAFALWNAYPSYSVANEALAPFAATDNPASFANVIEAVRPAVVNISVNGHMAVTAGPETPVLPFGPDLPPGSPFEDFMRRFFDGGAASPDMRQRPFESAGTGFIIDPDGLVVTNYHVVRDAEEITVTMDDGSRHAATLRGNDEKTDLALLEMEGEDFPFVAFGDSDAVRVGDWIVAIGNPFGLGGSATTGIVSARGRDIQSGPFDDFLQIDAPINRGNSGGPLFDLNGRVVGVNTAIFTPNGGNVGVGFAIPAAVAEPVIAELREIGRVERGWLGVGVQALDEELASGFGLDSSHGALVADVVAGSPAAEAGLKIGDVVVSFNGEPIDDVRELVRLVGASDPRDDVVIEVWRSGDTQTLTARLGEADEGEPASMASETPEAAPSRLGIQVDELDDMTRRSLRLRSDVQGVVIAGVARESVAARKGLSRGDIVVGVGQSAISSVEDFDRAVAAATANGHDSVVLQIVRGEARLFVALPLG